MGRSRTPRPSTPRPRWCPETVALRFPNLPNCVNGVWTFARWTALGPSPRSSQGLWDRRVPGTRPVIRNWRFLIGRRKPEAFVDGTARILSLLALTPTSPERSAFWVAVRIRWNLPTLQASARGERGGALSEPAGEDVRPRSRRRCGTRVQAYSAVVLAVAVTEAVVLAGAVVAAVAFEIPLTTETPDEPSKNERSLHRITAIPYRMTTPTCSRGLRTGAR